MVNCQNSVEDADDFGALKNLRDLALPGNQFRGLLGPADDSRSVDFDTVEMHTGITLHQVDRPLRLDSYAGSVRRHQELAHRALAVRHHQKHSGIGARFDTILHTVEPVTGVGGRRRHTGIHRRPRLAGFIHRPRCDDVAGDQRFDCVLVVFGSLDQAGEHGADRMQWPGRHGVTRELGHHRQVLDAVTRHRPAPEFLRHQQAGPAEFGGPSPPVGVERDTGCVEFTQPGKRRLFFQERLSGRGEEQYLGVCGVGHGRLS